MSDKLKKVYISSNQRTALLAFMEKEVELRAGKFTNTFTYKTAQKLWETIATELNSMPGATKNWLHWRKTWQDIKNKTKSKKAAIVRHAQVTGGGPPSQEKLTSEDERVLELIHPLSIEGDTNVPESTVEFDGLFSQEEGTITIDHDYNRYEDSDKTDNTMKKENVTPLKEHPILERGKNKIGRILSKPARLNRTIAATSKLAEQNEVNINIKKDYCKQKLELMREDVQARQRIAAALERIADHTGTVF